MEQFIQSTTTESTTCPIPKTQTIRQTNTLVMDAEAAKYVKSKAADISTLFMRQPSSVQYVACNGNQGKLTYCFTFDDWVKNIWLLDTFTLYTATTDSLASPLEANLRIHACQKGHTGQTPLLCVQYALRQSLDSFNYKAHPDGSGLQTYTYTFTPSAVWDAAGEKCKPITSGGSLLFPTLGASHSPKQTSLKFEFCITATIDQTAFLTEMAKLASLSKPMNALWSPSLMYHVVQVVPRRDDPLIAAVVSPLTDSLSLRITSTGNIIVQSIDTPAVASSADNDVNKPAEAASVVGEPLPLVVFPTPSM